MTLKYLLLPGPVRSKTDGQVHNIDASQLAHCYGIPLVECLVVNWDEPKRERDLKWAKAAELKLISLSPRYHGDYREHLATAQILSGDL